MENLGFLIFIIVIFLLQAIGQILTRKQKKNIPYQGGSPREQTLEDILESMGLPIPKEEEPLPQEILPPEKKDEEISLEGIELEKTVEERSKKEQVKDEQQKEEILLYNNLEDAIIYSAIIGPPKSRIILSRTRF